MCVRMICSHYTTCVVGGYSKQKFWKICDFPQLGRSREGRANDRARLTPRRGLDYASISVRPPVGRAETFLGRPRRSAATGKPDSSRLRALLEVDDLWLIAGAVHFAAVDAHHIARVIDDVFAACSIPRARDGVLFHLTHAEVHREDIASGGHQV